MPLKHWSEINASASRRLAERGYEFLGETSYIPGGFTRIPSGLITNSSEDVVIGQILMKKGGKNYAVSLGYVILRQKVTRVGITCIHGTTKSELPSPYGIPESESSKIEKDLASGIRADVGDVYKRIIADEGIDFS